MKNIKNPNIKLRYNTLNVIIYVIGIILLMQLFNLQIIHGTEFRETSNTRLTRESMLYATRGKILDANGNELATSKMMFTLEFYKTKIENDELNNVILKVLNTLEKNGDTYIDTFPIKVDTFEYTFSSNEKKENWLKTYGINKDATAKEAFYYFKNKYNIKNEDINEIKKIITIRYRITSEGYSSTKYITISNNISRQSAIEFGERNNEFPGITVVKKANRYYENNNLASHILGYVGRITSDEYNANKKNGYTMNDEYGRTAIESLFEKYLKGKNGTRQIDMSVDGTVIDEYIIKEAVAGSDVVLTIDSKLQEVTEKALVDTISDISSGKYGRAYGANAGAIVVMNVKNGDILAMASYPDYDPNSWVGGISNADWNKYNAAESNKPLWNRAIQSAYAPGSTFKMMTAISALESGKVTLTEKVNDTGVYPRGHNPVCWMYKQYRTGHGYLNITDAIKKSCNYFFYEMGYRIGIDTLDKYATYFGLGKKTNIELPNEEAGTLASKKKLAERGETWSVGHMLNASIGQGDNNFTPLQMAKYISMIVNGGNKVNPSIIKTIKNADGSEISRAEIKQHITEKLGIKQEAEENIQISQNNINAVLEGMRGVTSESGGTAYAIFRNFNIEIGGKTGSAQTGVSTNAWFVGFAPYDNPEIAVVVLIENGGTGSYAAYGAREIIAQYFGMNQNFVQEDITAISYTDIQN